MVRFFLLHRCIAETADPRSPTRAFNANGRPVSRRVSAQERCVSAVEYRRCGLYRLDLGYTSTTLPILCVQRKHVDVRVANVPVYLIEFTVRAWEGFFVENAPIWYLSVCHVVIVIPSESSHPHFPLSRTQNLNLASRHRTTCLRFPLFEWHLDVTPLELVVIAHGMPQD